MTARDGLEMHQACRDAVVAWWEQREQRVAVAGARRPAERPWPRFTPGQRDNVRLCHWGTATYVGIRSAVEVPEGLWADREWVGADHEWIVYRVTERMPMRRWTTTPSLTFVLPAIARMT